MQTDPLDLYMETNHSTIDPVDEWHDMENEHLRQELDEIESKVEKWKALVDIANNRVDQAEKELSAARIKFNVTMNKHKLNAQESNNELVNKCSTYFYLFEEYEKILAMYVEHTSMSLVTTRLKTLRQEGGLDSYAN